MRYLLLLAAFVTGSALATSVPLKPLDELVREADHVVIATITRVDMVDAKGRQVVDRAARTGPGLGNTMRLHLARDVVLSGAPDTLPRTMTVPLWTAWHYGLGSMQDQLTGGTGIFLLKSDLTPVYPADFQRPLSERQEIERLLRLKSRAAQGRCCQGSAVEPSR